MKSLIRWTATLGLVGTTMLTSLLGSYSKALALPEEQIVKTLQFVPVFAIADDQGVPLIAVGEKEQLHYFSALLQQHLSHSTILVQHFSLRLEQPHVLFAVGPVIESAVTVVNYL